MYCSAFGVEATAAQAPPAAPLTDQELQQWETRWQMMDALITFAVKHYASATGLEELRSTLLDILLDSRYRLARCADSVYQPRRRPGAPVVSR